MTRTVKHLTLHFALAAMVLRALLPVGWMPGPSASLPLVLCTMNGPVQVMVPLGDEPSKHKTDDGSQHGICPFAASVHFAVASAAPTLAPSSLSLALASTLALPRAWAPAKRHTPQSPRAPPQAA